MRRNEIYAASTGNASLRRSNLLTRRLPILIFLLAFNASPASGRQCRGGDEGFFCQENFRCGSMSCSVLVTILVVLTFVALLTAITFHSFRQRRAVALNNRQDYQEAQATRRSTLSQGGSPKEAKSSDIAKPNPAGMSPTREAGFGSETSTIVDPEVGLSDGVELSIPPPAYDANERRVQYF